jgi:hypothetical protein
MSSPVPNASSIVQHALGWKKGSRKALEIMLRVRSDSMLLRYFTEEECLLAHKTGGLPYVRHDAGIFFPGATVASACGDVAGRERSRGCLFLRRVHHGHSRTGGEGTHRRLSRYVYETRKEWLHA